MPKRKTAIIIAMVSGLGVAIIAIGYFFLIRNVEINSDVSRLFNILSEGLIVLGWGGLVGGMLRLLVTDQAKKGIGMLYAGTLMISIGFIFLPKSDFWPIGVAIVGTLAAIISLIVFINPKTNLPG